LIIGVDIDATSRYILTVEGDAKMEYSIKAFAELAGISTRTLRYYDSIGLLKPSRINEAGYRFYTSDQCDRLQQILLSRELGMSIHQIATTLPHDSTMRIDVLQQHLFELKAKRDHLDRVIQTVEQTILHHERGTIMTDKQKFTALKQKNIQDNEAKYGQELRANYGNETMDQSNRKYQAMDSTTYAHAQTLASEIIETLKQAMEQGDATTPLAEKAAALHKEWLMIYWPKYEKAMHRGLGDMYVQDERFTAYYDQYKKGMAQFLRDAIYSFTK